MDKLKSFICDSKTFGGFAFDGCYTMSRDVFFKLMDVYMQTGENLLDNYSDYIYLKWEEVSTHGSYYNIGECDRVGENDILNYQPLCKSCNSRKGTNTTDYRKSNA